MSFTVAAYTLGCKVNHYDSEAILSDFADMGFELRDFKDEVDVLIINTCTVTNVSDKKSRQVINRAYRQNPKALIVAYGCYAQVEPEALAALPGVSMVVGTADKQGLAQIVAERLGCNKAQAAEKPKEKSKPGRSRAYLKVQDGCDRYCSYCIVPYARGGPVSRTIEEAYKEAEALVEAGCKEIVLSGIQIASYGNDLDSESNLINLMKRIHDIPGLKRLRLSSLEPNLISDDFLHSAYNLPKLCDHFHLSLQSGCDRTLKRMNRRYTTAYYSQAAEAILSYFPKAALTTDIIVGFPGETDADFAESLAFAEKMGFFRIHVFPYSKKNGTAAASYPGQLDLDTKNLRSQAMRSLADRLNRDYYRRFIGLSLAVLFESQTSEGLWEGHTTQYMTVNVASSHDLKNCICKAKIIEEKNGTAYGALLDAGF